MKTKTTITIATVVLLFASCMKEALQNPSSVKVLSTDDLEQILNDHFIGEHFGGGIIFWLDSSKKHGLIAAKNDIGSAYWGTGFYVFTGATSTAIGSGFRNTLKIIKGYGIKEGTYAALLCAKYKSDGYIGWYLPSKDELNEMFKLQHVIGGFDKYDIYWSSSEVDISNAWDEYFFTGDQGIHTKTGPSQVRPIRSF